MIYSPVSQAAGIYQRDACAYLLRIAADGVPTRLPYIQKAAGALLVKSELATNYTLVLPQQQSVRKSLLIDICEMDSQIDSEMEGLFSYNYSRFILVTIVSMGLYPKPN